MDYKLLSIVYYLLGNSNDNSIYETIEKLQNYDISSNKYGVYETVVGSHLVYDGSRQKVCEDLLALYISGIERLTNEEKIDEAIELYKKMIVFLYQRYVDDDIYLFMNQETLVKKR